MQSLSQLHKAFQQYMSQNSFNFQPKELYQPIDYVLSLGGKRMRPISLLMSYNLFKEDIEHALAAAYAIEIFHNFTLLHDDIMDEAPLRRGKQTVHLKYDTNTGILSGDVMMIYAYRYLLKTNTQHDKSDLIEVFNKVATEVCEGQQMDMNFEKRSDVSIPEYLKMIELKTAVLLGGAMQIGALAAGASNKDAQHLYEFGRNVGVAFQLQDDLLDSFGDPEKFGKKVGGDIAQNKKTWLLLKALEIADPDLKNQLSHLISAPSTPELETKKIESVKTIYQQLDIPKLAESVKQSYQEVGFRHLDAVGVAKAKKSVLKNMAEELLGRES